MSVALVGLVAVAPTVARAWTHDSQTLVLAPKPTWASSVATMADGTSFQALTYKGSVTLGSVTLTAPNSTDWRWAVVKFDPDGDAVWGKVLPEGSGDVFAVAVDTSGNSYVSGNFRNTVTVGSTSLVAVGGTDAFVTKLNSSGVVQWARGYGSSQDDWSHGVGVDGNGNVFVGGGFRGTMAVGSTSLTSAGDNDLWIAKLSSTGVPQWAKSFGGTGDENGGWSQGLAVDSAGNAYLSGQINSSFTVNGVSYNTAGALDAVVAKIDASGNWQWLATGGSTAMDHVYGVAVDGVGNVYVTGQYSGNATWGAITTTNVGSEDGYVAKISAAGTWQWVKRITSSGSDYGYGIAATATGTVTVTGDFNGSTVSVDGETLTRSGSSGDGWVGQWNSSGTRQWAVRFGSAAYDGGFGVGVDANGNSYISGQSDGPGSATFGSGAAISHLSGCTSDCLSSFLWAISPSGGVPTTTTTTSSTTSTVASTTTSVVQTSTTVPQTTVPPSNSSQASGATTTTVKTSKSTTSTTVGSAGGTTNGEAGSATGVVASTTTAVTVPTPSVGDSGIPTITELPLGMSSARVGGKAVSTSMKREANKIVLTVNGMVATVGGATATGELVSLDAEGNLRVMPGDMIDLTITGLEPESSVNGWLFSDPTELGSLDVSSNGEARGSVTVPETVESGSHTLTLVMTDRSGQPVEAGLGIAVGELETGSSTTAIALGLLAVATIFAIILPVALRRRRVLD